jgi:hypothetical protein
MHFLKRTVLPILLATIWISMSEFVRNSFLVHTSWLEHYDSLGLVFPETPANGVVWGIWSLCFAVGIYVISTKFSLLQTTLLAWFSGFVWMWLVVGNMGVLPLEILYIALPLSILESFIASLIIFKLKKTK